MLDPAGGGALPPNGSIPPGDPSPGPDLKPRALWIGFVLVALGVPIAAWLIRGC